MLPSDRLMLRRLPIESAQPILVFAIARLTLVVLALTVILALGFPYEGRSALVLGVFALPWAVVNLWLARRTPGMEMNLLVAVGDFTILLLLQLLVPETLGAVRVAALFFIAAHSHFQGERRGLALAAVGSATLVVATQIRGDEPVSGDILAFYETVFVVSALATAVVVGTLRTAESASRMRAQGVSRRILQSEGQVRRRVAESIHDGPVQELIGLDMILSAAGSAAESGDTEQSLAHIKEARALATRNLVALRDEIVDLGPHAFEEFTFDTAVENCIAVWNRRYDFEVLATIERIELPPEMAGDLFRIAQEAVVNAGRHSGAEAVSVSLRTVNGDVELRVTDNGDGFADGDPLASSEPGHLGLASMRERAELLDGSLDIETSQKGTRVRVRAPLPPRRG
jgi:signal transduction histidine kinase